MTLTEQILTQVIAHRFPWWGQCHFQLNHHNRTLYIHSSDLRKRRLISKDMQSVATLDIHIQRITLQQPNQPDISIQCVSKLTISEPSAFDTKETNRTHGHRKH